MDRNKTPLIPSKIESYADQTPPRVYASVPRTSDPAEGFRDITYKELARAIDKASWWLDDQLGPSKSNDFPTFAYYGPNRLEYVILFVASIKTGRKILLPSSFASLEGLAHIFSQTGCTALLTDEGLPISGSSFDQLLSQSPCIRRMTAPDLQYWLSDDEVPRYVYFNTIEDALDDPIAIFHTSGTTGLPKPVIYTNHVLAYFFNVRTLSTSEGALSIDDYTGRRIYAPFPLLHLGGMSLNLFYPLYYDYTPVFGPYGIPLTADLADSVIRHGDVSGAVIPPFLLETMAKEPTIFKTLCRLDMIRSGSATISRSLGERLCSQVHFQYEYGSTEMTFPPYFKNDPEDWNYLRFHPSSGIAFVQRDGQMYELVIVRRPGFENMQPVFKIFPELKAFYSKDLWTKHQTKPDLWTYCGRIDDMLRLTTGVDIHVTSIEAVLCENPLIIAALVGGEGRAQPFLLLEVSHGIVEEGISGGDSLFDEIWEWVTTKTNLLCAASAQLNKIRTIITPQGRPFPRSAKGAVDRRQTLRRYEIRINGLYAETNGKAARKP
ncbi:hypothetical protein MMC25_003389 [Agyrium rufum]|nr:hypothetical protein [Agyrium rufum]